MNSPKSKSPKSQNALKISDVQFLHKDNKIVKSMMKLIEFRNETTDNFEKLDISSSTLLSDINVDAHTIKSMFKEIQSLLECKDPLLSLIIDTSRMTNIRINILTKNYGIVSLNYIAFTSKLYKDIFEKNGITDISNIKDCLRILQKNIEILEKNVRIRRTIYGNKMGSPIK